MKQIYEGTKVPIKSWCDPIEEKALGQARNAADHPCVVDHVAIMPDAHFGYGVPIGTILALEDAIIPYAVGSDIGCGMRAVRTDFPAEDITTELIKQIFGYIREEIPVGFKRHTNTVAWKAWSDAPDIKVIRDELPTARYQLGTLGGGNHFIEIQSGDDGFIWLMIHSGSRHMGKEICDTYHDFAVKWCEKEGVDLPDDELAFLPVTSHRGEEYIEAMRYALKFARENRGRMMEHVIDAARDAFSMCNFGEYIDIHHNFAALERHDGWRWIHRKGATQANLGMDGIIPGSMGTPSYIVKGLGSEESFQSCSHGAGRAMGRNQASRELTVEKCDAAMDGIVYGRWSIHQRGGLKGKHDLGEAPQAYKDIDVVMAAQVDLVEPVVKLQPLGVVKG